MGLPIQVSGRVLIEPLITVDRTHLDEEERPSTGSFRSAGRSKVSVTDLSARAGAYLLLAGGDALSVFVGSRVGWYRRSTSFSSADDTGNTLAVAATSSGLGVAALLALQSRVARGLTIGGELEWNYRSLSGTTTSTLTQFGGATPDKSSIKDRESDLSAIVVIRWYPRTAGSR
jgi:hypothetical protein